MAADIKLLERLGEAVKRLRQTKGLSQSDLATLSGITQGSISRMEAGRLPMTFQTLWRICLAMQIRPWAVLAYADMLEDSPFEGQLQLIAQVLAWAQADPGAWRQAEQVLKVAMLNNGRWDVIRTLMVTPQGQTIP